MSAKLITLVAPGSRGDVIPAIALGVGLKQAGKEVKIATNQNYKDLTLAHNLKFVPISGNFEQALNSERGLKFLEGKAVNPFSSHEFVQQMIDAWNACQGSDAIVFFPPSLWVSHIAEKLQIPGFFASFLPIDQTKEFFILNFQNRSTDWIQELVNWNSYSVVWILAQLVNLNEINSLREYINLPKLSLIDVLDRSIFQNNKYNLSNIPSLYYFSSTLVKKPKDWTDHKYITGNWFLPSVEYQLNRQLLNFIEAGEKPVYIGFGSMTIRNSKQLAETLAKSIEQTKIRVIIGSGWSNLEQHFQNSDKVYIIKDFVPFDWLFPKLKFAIHHGGSGTVACGIKAGIPQIILPIFTDQFCWAEILYRQRLSPRPVSMKKINVDNLNQAILNLLYNFDCYDYYAKVLQNKFFLEANGVEQAAKIIDSYLP